MRNKNKIININKDLVKRKKFLKIEIKKIILKSIFKNENVNTYVRLKVKKYLDKYSHNKSISKQNNNICLISGRIGGVFNKFGYSRQVLKKIGINNNLQNYKISGW